MCVRDRLWDVLLYYKVILVLLHTVNAYVCKSGGKAPLILLSCGWTNHFPPVKYPPVPTAQETG